MNEQKRIRKIGLARVLSKLGYCSRSRAAELIRAGRVSVNGMMRRDPEAPVSENNDQIAVDGKLVERSGKIYLMMNKPRGVVTTASDEKGRDTVYTILSDSSVSDKATSQGNGRAWVAPVGRLDKASEGLFLLTNDSEWAARATAPGTHLDKTYHVQLNTVVDDKFVEKLMRGVKAKDGVTLRAKRAHCLRAAQKTCWLEIILDEGKNRQIRRMIESLDAEVLRLIRVAIGPLQLGDLPKGQSRALTSHEKRMLDRAMQS